MKIRKLHPIEINFYLGDILEKDNKYYFLNPNEFKDNELAILHVGEIFVDYVNLNLKDWFDIIRESNGSRFGYLLLDILKKTQEKYGFIMANLLCNKLITLTNELLASSDQKEFYTKAYGDDFSYDKFIEAKVIPFVTKLDDAKDILLSFFPYMRSHQILHKEFINDFFGEGTKALKILTEILPKSTDINYTILPEIDMENETRYFHEIFKIKSLDSFIFFDILKFIDRRTNVNKCEICDKYFVPKNKSNEKYCDNILKNSKTCKELSYEINLEQNEIENIYRTSYKTQNAKKQRNSHIKEIDNRFVNWTLEAKKQKELCKNNKISIEDFREWLKKNENWHKVC